MAHISDIIEQLRILADLLCKPLQLTEKAQNHSAPLYLYELTKIIRLYAPMLYYCDKKLITGTTTDHIMRIHLSPDNKLFVTDFKNIYRMEQIHKTKKAKKKKKKQNADRDIYAQKVSKRDSKKMQHRTISKKKLSPFFKCSVLAATKIDENFQIDPDGNIFYVLGVGFFKEAIFVLRRKQSQTQDDQKESAYSKPRRMHTFGSGEGNRIIAVNPLKFHKEKKKKYVILHSRALNRFFRMKYCVETHDLKVEKWRISAAFPRIQWLISYPFSENLCFGMIVDWDINMVILYGILVYTESDPCTLFEISRFELREFDAKDKGRIHHCYCMCYLKKINKLCVVVEGECFLVYHDDDIDVDDDKKKMIQSKSVWNKYHVGILYEKDVVEGTKHFYPKSITQFKDTNFVIGVNGTEIACMFQIL